MGFKKKTGKGRLDKYYHYAKEQGYRARSAFKLIQLNKKFDFLASARCVIDLCAAPGGWLQVAAKYMPVESLIIGVDLAPIKPIPKCITFQEDITSPKCRAQLRTHLKTWKADVVLHDGAPNVGSAWAQDAFSQSELVLESLKLAVEFLNKGGIFVTKVFRSKDYNNLMWVFNQLFSKVEATKPPSSRNVSAEIFVVCQDFLAPKKIDPKFLDIKYVFKELDADISKGNVGTSLNVFMPEKRSRQREGYADGATTLHNAVDVMDLINAEDPVAFLATINQLKFQSDKSKELLNLLPTKKEIRILFEDLKVLGKRDFKNILKWRTTVKELLNPTPEVTEEASTTVVEEESLEDELKRLAEEELVKNKKAKRKVLEKRQKELIKTQLKMTTPVDIGTSQGTVTNFSSMSSKKANSKHLGDGDMDDDIYLVNSDDEEVELASGEEEEEDISDTEKLEKQMEAEYEQYKSTRLSKLEQLKIANPERYEEWHGIENGANSGSDEDDEYVNPDLADSESESDLDNDEAQNETKPGQLSSKAAMWFDQPIFKTFSSQGPLNPKPTAKIKIEKKRKLETVIQSSDESDDEPLDSENEIVSDEEVSEESQDEDDGMPEVSPAEIRAKEAKAKELNLSSAEAMTLALKLVNKEITKADLVSSTFSRYAFNDTDDLPAWFREDEKKHYQPNIPITKEAATEIRERMKAMDARPIKKVAEAKARKKYKTAQRMAKLAKKATTIADASDMTEQEKAKSIEKIMRKKTKKVEKPQVKVVVARGANRGNKGRPKGVKGRYKMVDPRMKKETRALKRVAKKSAKKRR